MAREGFVVYHELLKWLEPYGDTERGRLFTAMLNYSVTGEEPGLSGAERFIWPAIREKIDRDREAYEERCATNRNNRQRSKTIVNDRQRNAPTETKTGTETRTKTKSPSGSISRARGEYGWVKLTDAQYEKLLADLGQEELDRCIRYVDESAQKTRNKNKWSDWNLVIRSCHRDGWGLEHGGKKKQFTTAEEYRQQNRPTVSPDELWKAVDSI